MKDKKGPGRPQTSKLDPNTHHTKEKPPADSKPRYKSICLATSTLPKLWEIKVNMATANDEYRYMHTVHVGGNDSLLCFERIGA